MNTKEPNVEIKIKEKKIYLTDNKNDMYQKGSVDYLKTQIIKSTLYTYNRVKPNDMELKKFLAYLDKRVKPNKSKNDINYRIESLFNYIISLYSDYVDFIKIVTDDIQSENQE
mgnify:CR=1 FL=1